MGFLQKRWANKKPSVAVSLAADEGILAPVRFVAGGIDAEKPRSIGVEV
jgi:hypothetical protein